MHSVAGDTVLDPFLGTGTTMVAAIASARSSVGVEIDPGLMGTVRAAVDSARSVGLERARARLLAHRQFVDEREKLERPLKHRNKLYGFPVVTGQEVDLVLYLPASVEAKDEGHFRAAYTTEVDEQLMFDFVPQS